MKLTEADFHPHLQRRMAQRGISRHEIERTLNEGWQATNAKTGTEGKVLVFAYEAEWEGRFYEEKEITVYYKLLDDKDELVLLTAIARYGQDFPRR